MSASSRRSHVSSLRSSNRVAWISLLSAWRVLRMFLRPRRVRAQQVQEPADVQVVERSLDLVENVERAGPGEEHREQKGERRHRLLTAGEQREAFHLLAGRSDLDLDPEDVLLELDLR